MVSAAPLPSSVTPNEVPTTRKGSLDMNTKEKNFPVVLEDGITNEFNAPVPDKSQYSGEFSIGPVRLKSKSRSSDNSSSIIGGVLAGGAVAIGAVAVTLTLLGAAKSN